MSVLRSEMIKRQILLIKNNFPSYPSSEEDTEARINQTLETGIWPLVNHISSFNFPHEFSDGILKLSNFPFDKEDKDKWLNQFAYGVNNNRMYYSCSFTEEDAINMQSNLGEILNALNAIKIAIPFIHIEVVDLSEKGEIFFSAMDNAKEESNLLRSIGG